MMNSSWPPSYEIRRSERAKRINIKLCPKRGLQIILPDAVSKEKGIAFLEAKRAWVTKHQHLLQQANKPIHLPVEIQLNSFQYHVPIHYEKVNNARIKLINLPEKLVIIGDIDDAQKCFKTLKHWLKDQAEKYFKQWLKKLCEQTNLSYNQLIIRGQNTRWGSCNSLKTISLNYKLLFFPYAIVEYVLIHELCHTVHLNHSAAFWTLVKKYSPNYIEYQNKLKNSQQCVPNWV